MALNPSRKKKQSLYELSQEALAERDSVQGNYTNNSASSGVRRGRVQSLYELSQEAIAERDASSSTRGNVQSLYELSQEALAEKTAGTGSATKYTPDTASKADDLRSQVEARGFDYDRMASYDLTAAQAEIDSLYKSLDEAKKTKLETSKATAQEAIRSGDVKKGAQAILDTLSVPLKDTPLSFPEQKQDDEEKAIKDQIDVLERDYNLAKYIQNQNKYSKLMENADFEQYANAGAAIENPSAADVSWGNSTIFGFKPFDTEDRQVKNKVTFGRDNYDQLAIGGGGADESAYLIYKFMTDDEVATYNYLLAKEGEESADEYLDHMQEALNYRMGEMQAGNLEDKTVLELLYGGMAGTDQFLSGAKQAFTEEALPTTVTQYGSQLVREDLGDVGPQLPEALGGGTLGQLGYDVTSSMGNMAPAMMIGAFTGNSTLGAATMGISAGGSAYGQALKEGYTKQQATNYGLLTAASEAGLSRILGGISSVGGGVTKNVVQRTVKNIDSALLRAAVDIGINMAGEGTEEYLQTILEPVLRNLTLGENNEVKLVSEDAAYSFIMGALTSGILEAPGSIARSRNVDTGTAQGEASGENVEPAAAERQDIPPTQSVSPQPATTPSTTQNVTPRRAMFNDSGAAVDVTGISSVEDGKLYVTTSEGGTASVDDISFDDPVMDALYSNAGKYGTTGAQRFVEGYDGSTSVQKYARGFDSVYKGAKSGLTYDEAVSNSLYAQNFLSEDGRQYAYAAGQEARSGAVTAAPTSAVQSATYSEPGVKRLTNARLSRDEENQIAALDIVFKSLGRTVELVDSIDVRDESGSVVHKSGADAMFNPANNVYTIAVKGVSNAYSYFATHESVHDIKANNAQGYDKLQSVVLDYLRSSGEDVDGLINYQKRLAVAARGEEFMRKYFPTDADLTAYASEEVIANTVPVILSDPETGRQFAERFLQEDEDTRTAFGKLLDDILTFMRKAFDALTGRESWKQMRALEDDIEAITAIREAYFDALEGVKGSKTVNKESGKNAKYSINPDFAAEYDSWDGKDANRRFFVGKTSQALRQVGVKEQDIVWDASKIIKIKSKHPAMTNDVIKQVPSVIENPIIVMESKSVPGRITMFGELADAKGAPVLVALELEPTKDYRLNMDVIKIASAYGKDTNPQKLINESRILFVEPDKTKTQTWLKLYKLQLPSSAKYGFNSRVSRKDTFVNTSISKTDENNAVRFSLDDIDDVDTEAVEERDSKYIEATDNIAARADMTKGHRVSDKAIDDIANEFLTDYSSHYDVDKLKENLRTIFDHMSNAKKPSWKNIMWAGVGLTKAVIKESSNLNKELHERYKGVRHYLRNNRIMLSNEQRKEAAEMMGSYNDYRMSLFGSVTLAGNGTELKTAWQELSQAAPELFSPDAKEGDMPSMLLNAVQIMRPAYTNPYGLDMDGVAYDAFLRLCDMYFDLPEVKARAKGRESDLLKLKFESAKTAAQIRENSKTRFDATLKKLRAEAVAERVEVSRQYTEAKARGDKVDAERFRQRFRVLSDIEKIDKLLQQKAAFQEWKTSDRAKRKERDDKRKYKGRIEKTAKELYTWLMRPTDAKHVPEALRKNVADFLETVDFAGDKQTKRAQMWRSKLENLKEAIRRHDEAQENDKEVQFYADFDPDLIAKMEAIIDGSQDGVVVDELNAAQLKELSEVMAALKKGIMDANKLLANGQYQRISEIAEATMTELAQNKKDMALGGFQFVDDFLNLSQLDSFAYADKLGAAASTIQAELREGLDRKVICVRSAMDFMGDLLKDVDISTWTGPKAQLQTFNVKGGEVKLTITNIMELYCLNKRGQAQPHIYGIERIVNAEGEVIGGGIRIEDTKAKIGKKTVWTKDPDVTTVTRRDVKNIIKTLTPEQKRVADAMQEFLSTVVAGWGNEVSMQLYGYKKFTEENYWPIRTNPNNTRTNSSDQSKPGQKNTGGDLYAILNMGATKATVQGAHNPIMIGDFFDTFTRHVDDMATYNAFAVPLTDALKWFNYQGRDGRSSVKHSIERAYGKGALNYFTTLVRDINGTGSQSQDLGEIEKIVGRAKVAAIGANLSVVFQQPSAYVRAAAIIDAKYLAAGMKKTPVKSNIEIIHKYCPIAQWKSWGFYETNIGRSMRDLIVGDQSVIEKSQEKSMILASKADEITWTWLWGACEAEIKAKRKDLKPGSEEFNVAVGKRLSEVIDRTQVVDSVFHRSQIMRNKNGWTQMATAFMSEPTKSYNLMRNAVVKIVKSKDAKTRKKAIAAAVRVGAAVVTSQVINAAFKSVITAMRDDDEDQTYFEKYAEAFLDNLVNDIKPWNNIPYLKEVESILKGYNPSRLDVQIIQRLVWAGQAWVNFAQGKTTLYKAIYQTAQFMSTATGLAFGNALRDLEGFVETVTDVEWE